MVVPVAEFMSKYSFHFLRFGLFYQGIEDDDVFAPRETEEVGVGMA